MGKKTKQDPTGQAVNRRKGSRRLQNRLIGAERRVKQLFRDIPRTRRREAVISNADSVPLYDYQITATELEDIERRIRAILDDELLETQFDRMPSGWWWQDVVEVPYRQGTAEEVVAFNALLTAALIAKRERRGISTQRLEVPQVLRSSEYLDELDKVYVRNFGDIKTLSHRTADQVIGVINRGVAARKTPTDIAKDIAERFDVSLSSAKRLADTEINKAYTDAKLNATDLAADQTGLRAAVLHVSALLPTTRAHHAERHGNAYTTAQQRQWWDTGVNRINCHCSVRSILVDSSGKITDVELQETIQAEKEFFNE